MYSFTSIEDKNRIDELHRLIPGIIDEKLTIDKILDEINPLKKEIKLIYKNGEKPNDIQKAKYKELNILYKESTEVYFKSLKSWEQEMDKIIVKYKYITLRNFLVKNPLRGSIGNRPSLMYAVKTKKIAEILNIPILQTLYSGEPKLINNYPEEWLLLVYKEIDLMSKVENYNFDINKFKLKNSSN
jgi:hypothetical protein